MANYTPQQIEEILQEFFDVVGTRQYVGARYVPLFGRRGESSIDWDDSAPYEPLTIVNYQGNSYTSRTYVPAGIDISDETYWAMTGQYNAQVEAYRREVVQLQEDWVDWKTDTEDDLGDWKTQTVEDFTEAIDNLPGIIPSTAFDETNTVKRYIDGQRLIQTSNRVFVFIGDSYSVRTDNWVHYLTAALGLSSDQYTLIGAGSRGFVGDPTQEGDMSWQTLLQQHLSDIPDITAVTDVLIVGGSNDIVGYDATRNQQIFEAIGSFFGYARSVFPSTTLYHVGVANFSSSPTILANRQNIIRLYNGACYRFPNVVPIADLWQAWHYAPYLTDTLHPDANGSRMIAGGIVSHLVGSGGYFEPTATDANIAIAASGVFSGANVANNLMKEFYDGTNVTVQPLTEQFINVSNLNVNFECNGNWNEIFSLGAGWYVGGNLAPKIPITIALYNATDKFRTFLGELKIVANKVYIAIFAFQDNSTSYLTYTIEQAFIEAFTYVAPAIAN